MKNHSLIPIDAPGMVYGRYLGLFDEKRERWVGTKITGGYQFWKNTNGEFFWLPEKLTIGDLIVVAYKDQPHHERIVWTLVDFDEKNLLLTKGQLT